MSSPMTRPSAPAEAPAPARRGGLAGTTLVLLAATVALTLALAWAWRWTADDAFINFRAVRNILEGNGPVFNAGERVEVGTSPLWLWLLAALAAILPVDVAWISVVLGALGSAAGVLLACLGAAEINRSRRGPDDARPALLLPAGILVFLAVPATWAFLTSGLETGLTFAWLGAVWFGTARQAVATTPTRPVWLLVVLGLGPLVRPDLALVTGLVGGWLLVAVPSSWRRRLRDVAVAGAVPVAYQIFRMGWYGLLVPNTAVAKESSRQLWSRGFDYLADLVTPYHLSVPAIICAALLVLTGRGVGWDRRVRGLVAITLLAGLLQGAFVVRVGGDFMHGRLLLPALFQLLSPVALVPLPRRAAATRWLAVLLVAGLAAWAVVCAGWLRIDYPSAVGARGIADERGVYVTAAGRPHPVTLADRPDGPERAWARQVAGAARADTDQVFAANSVAGATRVPRLVPLGQASDATYFLAYQAGYIGYASPDDVRVLDFYGLTDPLAAHLEAPPPRRAGHDKILPITWFWARHADGPPERQSLDPLVGEVDVSVWSAARAALHCGELAELVTATSAPMSWSRFWDNLVGAPARTSLRIPADPQEAESRFC